MSTNIGPKIGLDGEREFRKSINDINQSIKTLGSEMKVVTSEFDNNEKSIESLQKQNDVYERTVLTLNEKLELQKKRLDETARAYGEADSRTQKLKQQVNETQAQINTYNNKIEENNGLIEENGEVDEETTKQIETDSAKQEKAHENVEKALKAVGTAFAAMSAAAVAAMAAAVTGAVELGQALFNMTLDAAYAADDLNTLSKQTGLSTEELQKFQYASDVIDVSVDTLTGSMSKLTKNMDSAASGSGDAYEAFKELGIEVTNQDGTLRDRNEVFNEAIAALGDIKDETNRDAVAMKIFGKSAQDLNPLILGGAEALEEMGAQAEAAGLILSQDDLNALNEVSDAMDTLKATTSAAGNLFSVGFAGPISEGLNLVTGYVQTLTAAFSEGGLEGVMAALPGVVEDMTATINEELPALMETGSQILSTIIDGLLAVLPTLLEAAVTILTTLIEGIIEALPQLAEAALEILGALADALLENLDTIIDVTVEIVLAIVEGIIDNLDELLAAAIEIVLKLVEALTDELPELIPVAIDALLTLVDTLTDPNTLSALIDAAIAIIIALANGLIDSLPDLLEKAPEIVENLVTAIIENVPKLIDASIELIGTLAEGLAENFPTILQSGMDIVSEIVEGIVEMLGELIMKGKDIIDSVKEGFDEKVEEAKQWGKDLMDNFIQGIKDKIESLVATVSSVASTVASYIGFSEPEKGPLSKFHTFAPDMMALFTQGIRDNEGALKRQLDSTAAMIANGMTGIDIAPEVSMSDVMAGAVNGIQAAVSGIGGGGSYTINLVMPDGTALATYLLPEFAAVSRANGTPVLNPA